MTNMTSGSFPYTHQGPLKTASGVKPKVGQMKKMLLTKVVKYASVMIKITFGSHHDSLWPNSIVPGSTGYTFQFLHDLLLIFD